MQEPIVLMKMFQMQTVLKIMVFLFHNPVAPGVGFFMVQDLI